MDNMVASPSFTVVRDSCTSNPEGQVANSSGSKITGVSRWISPALARQGKRTVCSVGTTCGFLVDLTSKAHQN